MTSFSMESHHHSLADTFLHGRFAFVGGSLLGRIHTLDCCLYSGSNWQIQVLSPVTMSEICLELPPSNLTSIYFAPFNTYALFPSVKVWGTHQNESFRTRRCSCRIFLTVDEVILRATSMSLNDTWLFSCTTLPTVAMFSSLTHLAITNMALQEELIRRASLDLLGLVGKGATIDHVSEECNNKL